MQKIKSSDDFLRWADDPTRQPAAFQVIDLRGETGRLLSLPLAHCLFLSCNLEPAATAHIIESGGIVIPDRKRFKFAPHRSRLYTVEELFAGYHGSPKTGYHCTYDYKIYYEYVKQGREAVPIDISLHRRLHDHSITDALEEELRGHKVVAIMGGHDMERREPDYLKVAQVARRLAREGYLVITGGGPGAMEAAHFGAWFAGRPDGDMTDALAQMAVRPEGAPPGKEYDDQDWLYRAWCIRSAYPQSAEDAERYRSIGIPTWFYGHEPPSVFATRIAKYFANSVREDGLLMVANHGIIFAPGNAGTVQEIFQDAAQNYYGTSGHRSPMILLGTDYWTKTYPAWPLLQKLAARKAKEGFPDLISLTDNEQEITEVIRAYDPANHRADAPGPHMPPSHDQKEQV
ncbi:hypothetical protein [Parvularcula sp. LCG005]|uniref:LOG family protein n=1 Tax=Parvularcula sp. LCG005 TaxID=3078805 RepID=UPI0029437B22|nr:hypothetical protein [Parvularcula sp. LCG005]WOI52858.1 hypothetical protein RUI03_11945 [Parvularcula sp. LCG005]